MRACLASSRALRRTPYLALRKEAQARIDALPEVIAQQALLRRLDSGDFADFASLRSEAPSTLDQDLWRSILHAAMATCCLHVESRISSLLGRGFYTIGPCGEEALAPIGAVLRETDPAAFHYRHLAPLILRHLQAGKTLEEIILGRALGYVVSRDDPVTGGGHCALGGGIADFVVTSTLASQTPPAVGRALAFQMASSVLKGSFPASSTPPPFPADSVSFVSLGDGSVANAHFLSAVALAQRAVHLNTKCPVLFCISDNDLCISLRGRGFLGSFLKSTATFMRTFKADGRDPLAVHSAASSAVQWVRKNGRPAVLVVDNIVRRFGHAATDRQAAYMPAQEVQSRAGVSNSVIGPMVHQAVEAGLGTAEDWAADFRKISSVVSSAFADADERPKVSRVDAERRLAAPLLQAGGAWGSGSCNSGSASKSVVVSSLSLPLTDVSSVPSPVFTSTGVSRVQLENLIMARASTISPPKEGESSTWGGSEEGEEAAPDSAFDVVARDATRHGEGTAWKLSADSKLQRAVSVSDCMRRNMALVLREWMLTRTGSVYVGEDVVHGGYYTVTSGLADEFGRVRVQDLPPDETTLLGFAHALSQCGLEVCCEIPYAKYLDCGADMFTEIALTHWLTCGRKPSAAGLIIRLQGFGQGVFGGNFHTTNTLTIPPGVDVVCYSNGSDYAMGWRYLSAVTRSGRVAMSVDSTHLLYVRDVYEPGDLLWECPFPVHPSELSASTDVAAAATATPTIDPASSALDSPNHPATPSRGSPSTETAVSHRGVFAFDDVVCYYGKRALGRRDGVHVSAFEAPLAPPRDEVLDAATEGAAVAVGAAPEGSVGTVDDDVGGFGDGVAGSVVDGCVKAAVGGGELRRPDRLILVVTYGSGVVHSLLARSRLYAESYKKGVAVVVVDSPYLSRTPASLVGLMERWSPDAVLFADVCKERHAPLLTTVATFQNHGLLPKSWKLLGAANTYNPLGNVSTFMSASDIQRELFTMITAMSIE